MVDLFQTLKLDAHNEKYGGKEIARQLDLLFKHTDKGPLHKSYSDWPAIEFLQIHNFKSAINDVVSVWENVLEAEKANAFIQVRRADTHVQQVLGRMAENAVRDGGDADAVRALARQGAKLMALCEADNAQDLHR